MHIISDRIVALDLIVNQIKIRAVAVYIPHCGYPQTDFDDTYDQLRATLGEARSQKRRLIVGGDFNSQINVGERGHALDELSINYNLTIANRIDDPWDE